MSEKLEVPTIWPYTLLAIVCGEPSFVMVVGSLIMTQNSNHHLYAYGVKHTIYWYLLNVATYMLQSIIRIFTTRQKHHRHIVGLACIEEGTTIAFEAFVWRWAPFFPSFQDTVVIGSLHGATRYKDNLPQTITMGIVAPYHWFAFSERVLNYGY